MTDPTDYVLPEMVDCAPHRTRMTLAGCQRMWKKAAASKPMPWDSLHACLSCPVGALRCGKSPPPPPRDKATAEACPRCGKETHRRVRMDLCMSCYNRERELLRGARRRGKTSTLRIGPVSAMMCRETQLSDARPVPVHRPLARDLSELIIAQSRSAPMGTFFGTGAFMLPGMQGELFAIVRSRHERTI